jgi:nicotinate-nucleotide pyrophosphorylase (carboxylating)
VTGVPAGLPRIVYQQVIEAALREDLGRAGDITSSAVIRAETRCDARIVAREPGTMAGGQVAADVFRTLDSGVVIDIVILDGEEIAAGDMVLKLAGPARPILAAERTALNLLGRLCGIATLTGRFVAAVEGTGARVADTRKTSPGMRALEKYAVLCGGGINHRFGLDDAVLIKDNHLLVAGSVTAAVERVRAAVGHAVMVEVEVDALEQLSESLACGVDAVLLDNMDVGALRRAVAIVAGRSVTEASGGITLETVCSVAETGVDVVSVGALTHSVSSLDLSLEVETVHNA